MRAHTIDDIEALVQSIRVRTRHVHDNLHKHARMSVTYMPNLVHMRVNMYVNCKPRMIHRINSMNMFLY